MKENESKNGSHSDEKVDSKEQEDPVITTDPVPC